MRKSPWFWLTVGLSLFVAACITDNREAGTSTTGTNPNPTAQKPSSLSGTVILFNGDLAALAEIFLRSSKIEVSRNGVPTCKVISSTHTNDSGNFILPITEERDSYMEIREATTTKPLWSRDSLQNNLRSWPDGFPLAGHNLGAFRLAQPGSIIGQIKDSVASGKVNWVGVRGTDNFVIPQTDGTFKLSGIGPGKCALMLVSVPAPGIWGVDTTKTYSVADSLIVADVKSGITLNLGIIPSKVLISVPKKR